MCRWKIPFAGSVLIVFMGQWCLWAQEKPRLAVLVVFDQLRGDYLTKWEPLFGKDGFQRLQREGTWFSDCHYPYATTATGPGHASLLTGTYPAKHGIIGNDWYDAKLGEKVYCATAERYEQLPAKRVFRSNTPPASPAVTPGSEEKTTAKKSSGSPEQLLVPTLGDVLKQATQGRSKVVGISLKDRSALLPIGRSPDGAYWWDAGQMVTSTYYRDRLPNWVSAFNQSAVCDRWFGRSWERIRPDLDYVRWSGPDDVFAEGKGIGQGRAFPHPMTGGKKLLGKEYYDALANSPFGNDFLLEFTKAAIEGEQLGQDEVPDLLVVSFSSNDLIGHTWGPDSQEVLDTTLRSDLQLAELLRFLDQKVGQGRYVVALTADHGVCPFPELFSTPQRPAERISAAPLVIGLELALTSRFGLPLNDGELSKVGSKKSRWIEDIAPPWIYLNHRLITARGLKVTEVVNYAAQWLRTQDGIEKTYTRASIEAMPVPKDQWERKPTLDELVWRSYHPERSGDVMLVTKSYYLLASGWTGTSHGTPHAYDTHVPLLFYGPRIVPRKRSEPVPPQIIASVLAQCLGVPAPQAASYPIPPNLISD